MHRRRRRNRPGARPQKILTFLENKAPAGMSAQNPDFLKGKKAPAGTPAQNPYFVREKEPLRARTQSLHIFDP